MYLSTAVLNATRNEEFMTDYLSMVEVVSLCTKSEKLAFACTYRGWLLAKHGAVEAKKTLSTTQTGK